MKKSLFLLLFLFLAQISAYSQVNVALGKPVSSDYNLVGLEPSKANDADGTNASYWEGVAPAYWKVDLQALYDLNSIVIRNYYIAGFPRYYTYNIEVSSDDITYTQIISKTTTDPTTDAGDTYTISPTVNARYIRVNMTGSDVLNGDGINFNVHISDFRAYGIASSPTYTITPTAGLNGTITPAAAVTVNHNANQTFTIAPSIGYRITDLLVDGASVGALPIYTFSNVTSDHTISATFDSPVNLALLKPASSDYNIAGLLPAKANDADGTNASYWEGVAPAYWKVDLQGLYDLTSIVIRNYYVPGFPRYYTYNIEISSDDVTYTQIILKSTTDPTTDAGDIYAITPTVNARYIRVNMTGSDVLNGDGINFNVHISDFRVYGKSPLTISGVTASNKIYDGTNSATVDVSKAILLGVFGGDDVSLVSSGASGTFADKNVGTSKLVSLSGFTLSGTNAGKYTLTQPTTTADITAKSLTIGGSFTANPKVYDGTVAATVLSNSLTLPDKAGSDVVTLTAVAVFDNASVGTGKTVSLTGSSLSGTDAPNYTLSLSGAPTTTANITAKPIVITADAGQTKVYAATDPSPFTYTNSALIGADVITGQMGRSAGENVGFYTYTVGTLTAGSNYTLSVAATPTFSITTKAILITANSGQTKVYNQADPVFTYTNNPALKSGDSFTGALARAVGQSVGTYAFTLGTLSAGSNYTLSIAATPTFGITPKVLTITGISAVNKIYDGSVAATLSGTAALSGIVTGDIVTLGGTPVANFASSAVANGIIVNVNGYSISGAQAANYSLTQPSGLTANITARELTIGGTFTANNKVYDGTTSATIALNNLTLLTIVGSDNVTLTAVAVFSDPAVGNGKTVSLTGSSLAGTAALNYTLSLVGAPTTTADISEFVLSVNGVTANNKVYDRTTSVTLNTAGATLAGIVAGDVVNLVSSGATGTFVNKNVGLGKEVTTTGFAITGPDAAKYSLIQPTLTADISPVSLIVTGGTADNKIYDGTITATLNAGSAILVGVLGTDDVNLVSTGATGTFISRIVGTAKPVSTTGFTLGGADAINYTLTQPVLDANITPATLTVSGATAINKVYDGTTSATINTASAALVGILGTDVVTLVTSGATGTFTDKNAGTAKTILTSGFALGGTDADNYTLTQPSITADISPKTSTVTANDLSKAYGINLIFAGNEVTVVGLVTGDAVPVFTISSPGSLASSAVGTYPISVTAGSDNNYSYTFVDGLLSVNKASLTATADNLIKFYGSANPALTITYTGFNNGETESVLDVSPVAATTAINTSGPGSYPITLTGGSDNNYNITLVDGTLDIQKAPLTITADNKTKAYLQANPDLTISYSGFVLGQDQSVLDELPVVSTTAGTNSDAGNYDINISGAAGTNYSFVYVEGILTINKADQVITFAAIPAGLRMTQEYQLSATSSSGLPVTFELSDSKIGSLDGNTLTITQDGNLTVTAVQAGNQNYNPAPDASQTIVLLPAFDNITSLFSPNNDGINDLWYIPHLEDYGKLEVTVYNRYGQAVYRSDSYKNDWDGTWNGYQLPSATYYYIIKSSTKGIIKGVVNIVR